MARTTTTTPIAPRALIYQPGVAKIVEPKVVALDTQPGADFLHDAVGGWIEVVPDFSTIEIDGQVLPCIAFCNEEGKLESQPINGTATWLWHAAMLRAGHPNGLLAPDGELADILVGPICVVVGSRKFLRAM